MDFDIQKKKTLDALYKPDQSKKGNVDVQIKDLLDLINDKYDYYTTSSCAGRINLFVEPKSGRKDHAEWLFVSHDTAQADSVLESVAKLPKETVWFRFESAILHICCRDMGAAKTLVDLAHKMGFKHSGIISMSKRIMVEIVSTERIDTPISKEGKLLVSEDYITFLVEKANKKLDKNRERIDKFKKSFSKL